MTKLMVDGKKVRELLAQQGRRQCDLAFASGIATGHLSNVLNYGHASPPTIDAIADALGVRWEDIVKEAEG